MLVLRNAEYLFIVITPGSTVSHSGSTWKGFIYGSNRTGWHLNCEQTNDLYQTELLERELFDHLTVCKQMIDI